MAVVIDLKSIMQERLTCGFCVYMGTITTLKGPCECPRSPFAGQTRLIISSACAEHKMVKDCR